MPLPVYRLRRWLAVITVVFSSVIAGMYFYARERQRNVLKEVPNKLGIEIKQTANGFQFSKSDGKRTLFTVQAGSVKQFKLDGSAELRNVSIILYGRDASRFDQIYGDDFSYDKKTGNVIARGDVQIDLEANPAGGTDADQATPKEMKNPIHLKTRDLVFNQESGDAFTAAKVDFRMPQASGSAVGVQYSARSNTLTLGSQLQLTLNNAGAATLVAEHGAITHDPRVIVLEHPRLKRRTGTLQADQATLLLGPENEVQKVLASGDVTAETTGRNADRIHARADEGEMLLTDKDNLLRTATLTGHVHVERVGVQPMLADAGRAILDFAGINELQQIHASDGVRLAQHAPPANEPANVDARFQPQDFEITSPVVDFFVAEGKRLERAQTSGAAKITITPSQNDSSQAPAGRTVVTAGRFDAGFVATEDGGSRLTSVHGAPDAKIVNTAPGVPDRVSTSQTLDATFLPRGGIASIIQQGRVAYTDNGAASKRTQAWAEKAVYTPADSVLVLTGSPRVSDGSMLTTADRVRINRGTGEAFGDGNVKSTYSDLKEQPDGALLASASPIHVTAAAMTTRSSPAIAVYQGNARLWQDANIIEAPTIEFDREHRSLVAAGTSSQPVSTTLVQGKASPSEAGHVKKSEAESKKPKKSDAKSTDSNLVVINSAKLTYSDLDRIAHYEGGVQAHSVSFTAQARAMDVYLAARSQAVGNQSLATPGRLDHMVAAGGVVVVQPNRKAEGDRLVYTTADDKFVLTGGPPSIFDAEHGKITGVSLTFFRADDRVLVEGEASTPVVTQTRVGR